MSRAVDGPGATGLTDAELDRLADFLVDVLEPDDADEVARLITDEPRWAQAHRALVAADASVRAELADLGEPSLTMPADVAAHLDDALRGLGRTPESGSSTAAGSPPTSAPRLATVSSLNAVLDRRRRIQRIGAIAAGSIAIAGVLGASISFLTALGRPGAFTANTGGAPAMAESDDGVAPPQAPGDPILAASQRNYTLGTLAQVESAAINDSAQSVRGNDDTAGSPDSITKSDGQPRSLSDRTPDALARLLDPTALRECLNAVRVIFPGAVTTVDYARFAGKPAVVMLVQQGASRTVVAVGPDCGRADADEQASVPVR